MKKTTQEYYTPKQGHIPVSLEEFLSVSDPVIAYDRFVEGTEINKYLKDIPEHVTGRIGCREQFVSAEGCNSVKTRLA